MHCKVLDREIRGSDLLEEVIFYGKIMKGDIRSENQRSIEPSIELEIA
jgi:hypothetical protein